MLVAQQRSDGLASWLRQWAVFVTLLVVIAFFGHCQANSDL